MAAAPTKRVEATSRARVVRWPALLMLTAAVAVMVTVSGDAAVTGESTLDARPLVPSAGAAESLSSTWYCAAGTIIDEGPADHHLVIANPSSAEAKVELTVYPVLAPQPIEIDVEATTDVADQLDLAPPEAVSLGAVPVDLVVEPRSVLRTRLGDLDGVEGEHAAALVESNVGDMIVEHIVSGPSGTGVAPCASASADSFHFAAGSTRKGARQTLSIFNPFPGDAVVDITFATDVGPRAPQIYDGLVVPSGSVLPVDITDVVTLFDTVSANLDVRTGRVVADRLLDIDGSQGPGGLSVAVGSPEPADVSVFPSSAPNGAVDVIVVHNPSDSDEAEVDVEIHLDVPEFNGTVEPVRIKIRPGRTETLVLSPGAELVSAGRVNDVSGRIVDDVGYWAAVRSLNGVPIVADHVTVDEAPSPVAFSASPGVTVSATSHMFTTLDGVGEVAVVNPAEDEIAALDLRLFAEGQEFTLEPIEVPRNSRLVLDLEALGVPADAVLLLDASAPVVAERRVSVGGQGSVTTSTLPVAGTTSPPDLPLL